MPGEPCPLELVLRGLLALTPWKMAWFSKFLRAGMQTFLKMARPACSRCQSPPHGPGRAWTVRAAGPGAE